MLREQRLDCGTQSLISEVLLPKPWGEQGHLGSGMAVDSLQNIDQVVVGIDIGPRGKRIKQLVPR